MPKKEKTNINNLINSSACFDLQFRQDAKKDRPNSPTYYRWKTQFIITRPLSEMNNLQEILTAIGCGKIHAIQNQARFSVQNIDEIKNTVVPYLQKNPLQETKKKDFDLWAQAVDILHKNKGKNFLSWTKDDFQKLINIQKESQKYKEKPKSLKWISTAGDLLKNLK